VDKYLTTARLNRAGIPTPHTVACQTLDAAMSAFGQLKHDVVIKPLFGAEGRGIVRITDEDLMWRTTQAILAMQGVVYMQEFVAHPGWDIRAFVMDGYVISAMKRMNPADWRTNVARGGTTEPVHLALPEQKMALDAARVTGAIVAGVDLMRNPNGDWMVIEVNAVPGWRALAETCRVDVAKRVLARAIA
jgi:ribosomal protein S6--L-glutamate ligase